MDVLLCKAKGLYTTSKDLPALFQSGRIGIQCLGLPCKLLLESRRGVGSELARRNHDGAIPGQEGSEIEAGRHGSLRPIGNE